MLEAMTKDASPEMPHEESKKSQARRLEMRKILSGEITVDSSAVTKLSIEEQKRLGIPTESVYVDLNPVRRG